MGRRRYVAAAAGLLALVVVDLALVLAAMRLSPAEPAASPSASAALSASATATPGLVSPAATSAAPPPSPRPYAAPLAVVLSAVDADVAYRVTTGVCGSGRATIELTTDGGRTWTERTTPYEVITRIQPTDAARAFVVGADETCTMGVRKTSDGAGSWPGRGALADILTRDARDPTVLRIPGGGSVAPCGRLGILDVARNSPTGAELLCADGTLRTSGDDGRTWSPGVRVDGALALDSRLVGVGVTAYVASAPSTDDDCAGVRTASVVGATVTPLGCLPSGAAVQPGSVALSVPSSQAAWAVVGQETWRSTDGLRTWSRP